MKLHINKEEFVIQTYSMYHTRSNCKEFEDICNDIIINDKFPDEYTNQEILKCFNLREIYTQLISWCLISNKWLDILANKLSGKRCIELYAGKGHLSNQLRKRDVNITPYDNGSWNSSMHSVGNVIRMDSLNAIKSINDNIDYILMSWIPLEKDNNKNANCVKVAKHILYKHPETKFIVIGENYGGCNANDIFFNMCTSRYPKNINKYFQSWDGIHDEILYMKPYIKIN